MRKMSEEVSREVDQLLKNREKYETWLERLESERDKVTSQAYDRVRSDYQKRLSEVVAQLRAHGQALENRLGEMRARVDKIEGEVAGRTEELEEARLRRMVGEYTDEGEWRELEGRLVDEVQRLEDQLETSRAEIRHLNEIVAQVGLDRAAPATAEPGPTPPESTTPESGVAEPTEASVPGPVTSSEPELEPEPIPDPPEPMPQPEATASIPPAEEPAVAEEGAPAEPELSEPAELSEISAESDEEGFLSLEELVLEDKDPEDAFRPGSPEQEAAPKMESSSQEESEAEVGDELAFLESLSLGSGEDSESFSFLEQHGSGTPQTIICPHCSAANDPAEWYCTECGEELPAE